MRTNKENKNKTTKIFRVAIQNIAPTPPSNIVLTLTLLPRPGGEMYGM
ncbi:MAG: hypothetical protein HRU07_03485 [Nitrosopumilus sp.]|nr:hypothetical protein [Nitrosopumilus sp.]NRA05221.1 hypothetical protein [Nitrosopumilus sp.]